MAVYESLTPRSTSVQLRFEASPNLKDVMAEFIKPELRRQFAQRSFYLYLRTSNEVRLPLEEFHETDPSFGHSSQFILDNYNAGIAEPHKGSSVYHKHFPLVPLLGRYRYPDERDGLDVLMQIRSNEVYDRQKLLDYPFDNAGANELYLLHHFSQKQMVPSDEQNDAYRQVASRLGLQHPLIKRQGQLPDKYHVTHATGVTSPPPLRAVGSRRR